MRRVDLAKRLISAANDSERKRLLAQNGQFADATLAGEIRKACYAAWTIEPVKVQRAALAIHCLAKINNNKEIQATDFWVSGISDITKAKFESAVVNLDIAAEILTLIRRVHDSAQTQVAKLIALAMLGRYDEAIDAGQTALKIFVSEKDELAAGKIEMNLSNIVSRRSLHSEAEKYCLSARRRFIKAGENSWRAMAENGLANTYTELNDFQKADRYYRMALTTARTEKMRVTEAEIDASLGNLAMLRGRYAEALNFLELSRQKYDELEMPHQSAIADLEIADIYSELNLGVEAAEIYERVTSVFGNLKLSSEEARARLNFGRTVAIQGKRTAADRELKRALKLFEIEKNRAGQTSTLLSLSKLAIEKADHNLAEKYLSKAAIASRKSENPRHLIQLNFLEGELFRKTGKFAKASKKLTKAQLLAKKHRQPNAVQSALNSLGKIAISRGETAKARSLFSSSIKIIEDLRSPLAVEEFSMAFFASKLEPFENLTQLLLKENKLSDALAVIERGRSRSLLDAIPGRTEYSNISGKLQQKLNELRAELNFLYKRFDNAVEQAADRQKGDISRIEKKLAETVRQASSIGITRSNLRRSKVNSFDFRKLQKQLGAATTLIEFVEFNGSISAFVITKTKIEYIRDLTTSVEVSRSLEELHFQFGALRYGNILRRRFLDGLKARADGYLKQLYAQLLRPLESDISGSRLVIVPAGILNYVPFYALYDGDGYVIERFDTSYAPSAGVWSALQERPAGKIKNSLLIGYADMRIPHAENEIREIQNILPHSKTFVGNKATFSNFLENASKFDLIHLACHGKFRVENPMFSSLHLADGWITVRDICSERLRAKLVTLSACETGVNKIFAGEEILGLARGFLTAGAKSLVVSLWAVNDVATGHLMQDLYKNLQRGESISASLRKAQLAFVDRGEHPFYWSPFIMIGR